MNDPRTRHEYGDREIEAAHRVLVDLGQVLGSYFADSVVVVGGWVPDLLLPNADEPHIGSIDIDLALDTDKLREGRYAEMVRSLLATRRYAQTDQPFKMRTEVDLDDGGPVVLVDVDFLKPLEKRRKPKGERTVPGFRPLDAHGCAAAFLQPQRVRVEGLTPTGTENRVQVLVASVPGFLIMKAYALAGRDKPKDAYDICYCLDNAPEGIEALARVWRERRTDPLVSVAVDILHDKFASVRSFGPQQVAVFYDAAAREQREMDARRAHELVARFLELIGGAKSSG